MSSLMMQPFIALSSGCSALDCAPAVTVGKSPAHFGVPYACRGVLEGLMYPRASYGQDSSRVVRLVRYCQTWRRGLPEDAV